MKKKATWTQGVLLGVWKFKGKSGACVVQISPFRCQYHNTSDLMTIDCLMASLVAWHTGISKIVRPEIVLLQVCQLYMFRMLPQRTWTSYLLSQLWKQGMPVRKSLAFPILASHFVSSSWQLRDQVSLRLATFYAIISSQQAIDVHDLGRIKGCANGGLQESERVQSMLCKSGTCRQHLDPEGTRTILWALISKCKGI